MVFAWLGGILYRVMHCWMEVRNNTVGANKLRMQSLTISNVDQLSHVKRTRSMGGHTLGENIQSAKRLKQVYLTDKAKHE
jgi:hypothetical protein